MEFVRFICSRHFPPGPRKDPCPPRPIFLPTPFAIPAAACIARPVLAHVQSTTQKMARPLAVRQNLPLPGGYRKGDARVGA